MPFGDLSSENSLKILHDYLATRSYIEGYEPSAADAVVFSAMKGAPPDRLFHAQRWYRHIESFGDEVDRFPGSKKSLDKYGPQSTPAAAAAEADDDEDDIDLFGSDDDDENESDEAKAEREKRLAEYAARKAKKPAVIAKSNVIFDVKPWDDETDMKELERLVRTIECDGLLWGASQLKEVAYGLKKLVISSVVEDEKVSIDWLEEQITEFEDHVQSVDIAAFNKI